MLFPTCMASSSQASISAQDLPAAIQQQYRSISASLYIPPLTRMQLQTCFKTIVTLPRVPEPSSPLPSSLGALPINRVFYLRGFQPNHRNQLGPLQVSMAFREQVALQVQANNTGERERPHRRHQLSMCGCVGFSLCTKPSDVMLLDCN